MTESLVNWEFAIRHCSPSWQDRETTFQYTGIQVHDIYHAIHSIYQSIYHAIYIEIYHGIYHGIYAYIYLIDIYCDIRGKVA